MDKKIEVFTAFIHKDSEGQEGLIAEMIGNQWMPFVAADQKRVLELHHIVKRMGIEFKIVRFTGREDITEQITAMVDPESYVGLSINEATEKAKTHGLASRITRQDGVPRIVTEDYKPYRLNFQIEKEIVTNCNTG